MFHKTLCFKTNRICLNMNNFWNPEHFLKYMNYSQRWTFLRIYTTVLDRFSIQICLFASGPAQSDRLCVCPTVCHSKRHIGAPLLFSAFNTSQHAYARTERLAGCASNTELPRPFGWLVHAHTSLAREMLVNRLTHILVDF